jgi:hypothetical protein
VLDVVELTVDVVDEDADFISGSAPGDTWVHVNGGNEWDWCDLEVLSEPNGSWLADFSGGECSLDLVPGTGGSVQVFDDDSDSTQRGWRIHDPQFTVNSDHDGVWGWDFEPNTWVDVAVSGAPMTYSVMTDGEGQFGINLQYDVPPTYEHDVTPGDLVTVSDGTTVKDHVVIDLIVDVVDAGSDMVSGSTDLFDVVDYHDVGVWIDDGPWVRVTPNAGDGSWGVDFMAEHSYDIHSGDQGGVNQHDDDGDRTHVYWEVAGIGMLRVVSSPAVPSQVLVDGVVMNSWGLTWVKVPAGSHVVSFTDVQGLSTPDPETVSVVDGLTTSVTGVFEARGWLQVSTSPAVPSTISVDGYPMNDWGVWTDLVPGSYEVCFGDVADYTAPGCETVAVTAGVTTAIEGVFTSSSGSPGPEDHGYLRATTNPAVPAQILIDGLPRDTWGLNWLKLPPGVYEVSFTDIQGFATPGSETVTVTAGVTTVVEGDYVARGWLQVTTSPALPATIYVDGIPRNDWGMWTDLAAGTYDVCFGDTVGYSTPGCQSVVVAAGANTPVTGVYAPDP